MPFSLATMRPGVGLKAAVLYSQLHADDACLKIATTSNSEEILYVQLRIDPDSEETAVVQKVAHFIVDEDHQCFSGTEMRLSIPCPEKITEVEDAADVLALYFQSLRYTAPPFLAVQFKFDVGGINTSVECHHQEEPIDRFVADLGASADDILYVYQEKELYSISCMALLVGNLELGHASDIEICLLRYANHVPLISGESVFLCGITKGISSNKLWKKYGLRCLRASSHLVNQLVASPVRASTSLKEEDQDEPIRLVIAVDICVTDSGTKGGLKYGSMRKSTLDSCYVGGVQTCCQFVLQQLAEAGRLCTPKQFQDQDLVTNFAPLLANAVAAIANRAQVASRKSAMEMPCPDDQRAFDEEAILLKLQEVLLLHQQNA
ncbi:hypothetical protein BBJ28_00018361 [Nothophytophthora sp. Chile5]|nr:hypothetical protein BBJ28_00018361 [Nothophytophthora sp. Chile5]